MRLFDLYGVPRPSVFSDENEARWMQLTLCLAFVHVRGLQFESVLGRTKTWSDDRCLKLYVDVLRKMRGGTLSASQICYYLAADPPWCFFIQSKEANPKSRQKSIGATLRRKFWEIQKQKHRAIAFVKEMERRWPKQFDKNLEILSEWFNQQD